MYRWNPYSTVTSRVPIGEPVRPQIVDCGYSMPCRGTINKMQEEFAKVEYAQARFTSAMVRNVQRIMYPKIVIGTMAMKGGAVPGWLLNRYPPAGPSLHDIRRAIARTHVPGRSPVVAAHGPSSRPVPRPIYQYVIEDHQSVRS